MGLFDRKSRKAPTAMALEPLPVLSAADVRTASELMDRWDAAMGDSDAMWDCIDAIARRGGFRGMEATLNASADTGDAEAVARRPWRWWAEAARLANAQGDHALAGRIFLFTAHFTQGILPHLDEMTQAEVGLPYPSGGTYQDIARSAADSLRQLPLGMLILNTATDQLDVAAALHAADLVASS